MSTLMDPQSTWQPDVDGLFRSAIAHQRQAHVAEARALYEQVIRLQPHHAGALHLLGALALAQGDAERACELIGRSVASRPNLAVAHIDLGNAQKSSGRASEALTSYARALELAPDSFLAHYNTGIVLQEIGQLPDALAAFERALRIDARHAAALFNRAVLLAAIGRPGAALSAYDKCLRIDPAHREALNNRGVVLLELGRPAEALEDFERALALQPGLSKALNNRGNALHRLHRFAEAVESFDRALALEPNFAEAHRNRGHSQRKRGLARAALESYETALKLRPEHEATRLDLAETLIELKRHDAARDCLTLALEAAPELDYARGLRMYVQGLCADWENHAERAADVVTRVARGERSSAPLPLLALTDSLDVQRRCTRAFVADKFPSAPAPLWNGKRYRHGKIRLAYLSGDLRDHAVSNLMVGVFEGHARDRFETLAISLRSAERSAMGQRVAGAFDEFIDVSGMSDQEVAVQLRGREIDILVDLMGYTFGSRTQILAHRAVPVQVNYLGFPGTMGAPYVDYLIADDYLIPANARRHYDEKIVWLPGCFQANDHRRSVSPRTASRAQLSLPDSGIVLCCFNGTQKINPQCFDIWMRLLRDAPGCVLWLLADEEPARARLRQAAAERGVNPDRLVFAGRVGYAEHLGRLTHADLFLDTLPFNAGATASDALWAGVPVLTCSGEAMASRMAGSLLRSIGLAELVTSSLERYAAAALELVSSNERLAELRARLARGREGAALFDTSRFTRHLEAAYTAMCTRTQSGQAPDHLALRAAP